MSDNEQFEPAEPRKPPSLLATAAVFLLAALGWTAGATVAAPDWVVTAGCVLASAPCYTVAVVAWRANRR